MNKYLSRVSDGPLPSTLTPQPPLRFLHHPDHHHHHFTSHPLHHHHFYFSFFCSSFIFSPNFSPPPLLFSIKNVFSLWSAWQCSLFFIVSVYPVSVNCLSPCLYSFSASQSQIRIKADRLCVSTRVVEVPGCPSTRRDECQRTVLRDRHRKVRPGG